jgi:hypothetical protein
VWAITISVIICSLIIMTAAVGQKDFDRAAQARARYAADIDARLRTTVVGVHAVASGQGATTLRITGFGVRDADLLLTELAKRDLRAYGFTSVVFEDPATGESGTVYL